MDTQKKTIQIKEIKQEENRIVILEEPQGNQKYPTRYSFFKTKQDGSESKAFQQFNELDVNPGKVYTIAVKETKGTNKVSGKEVTYRNVAFFYTGEYQKDDQGDDKNERLDEMAQWAKGVEKEISSLKEQVMTMLVDINELKNGNS